MAATATGLTTKIRYVALDVGTTNDSSKYYAPINEYAASLQQRLIGRDWRPFGQALRSWRCG